MELRFVVPNMEKTFGNLKIAGENTTERQKNERAYGCHYQKLEPVFRCAES